MMSPGGSLPWIDVVIRLVSATLCAGLIGLERERAEMSAGLRTHALVGLGSALIMIASAFGFADVLGTPNVVLDPSRIAAQVVSGIGFLGAGTILVQQQVVRGLTTAASIWAVAAIGLSIGGGLYVPALIATVLALVVLEVMRPLERRLAQVWREQTIRTVFDPSVVSLEKVLFTVENLGLQVSNISVSAQAADGTYSADIKLLKRKHRSIELALHALAGVPGVKHSSTANASRSRPGTSHANGAGR
jgi:putative Mg2+ transporter-C (MgtC) family protein